MERFCRIRHVFNCLILFFVLACCHRHHKNEGIQIVWKDDHASGLSIPASFYQKLSKRDSLPSLLTVHLSGAPDHPAIFGQYIVGTNDVVFEPLISFTPGLTYVVRWGDTILDTVEIPLRQGSTVAEVISIHPLQDSVPENLLKVYIQFSQPMQEGQSAKFVHVLSGQDTVAGAFLDLQPELWNHDRTLLTLWLDPGRIKRDLQPNRSLGNPLRAGRQYKVVVSSKWKSARGISLAQIFLKDFVVVSRDTISPDPKQWMVKVPSPGTKSALTVDFKEALDFVLSTEAIKVQNERTGIVKGQKSADREGHIFVFIPEQPWSKGVYTVQVQSRMEDLAGNNLNRPFDLDVSKMHEVISRETHSIQFEVE
jgi:hypothetical protein